MQMAIELENVNKCYPGFCIKNLNLRIPTGSITGLIGENGAGKTTTIKLILDLIRRDSGTIRLLGHDSSSHPKSFREHVGVVLDESCFPENLSTRDVDHVMARMYRTWDSDRFSNLLKNLSVPTGKKIGQFSRGMKTKLSIAAALSHDTRLLILDEPTNGLDPVVRDQLLDLFLAFVSQEDRTILMSSHVISDLEKACDFIAFLQKGQLIFNRSKDELIESYGVLRTGLDDLTTLDPGELIGLRRHAFGAEALVQRKKISPDQLVDPATMEDIMIYHAREANGQ